MPPGRQLRGRRAASPGSTSASARTAPTRTPSAACAGDSTPAGYVEYGTAIFHPGDVKCRSSCRGLVTELQSLDFDHDSMGADSLGEIDLPADSIAAAVERELDSAMVRRARGIEAVAATRRFADSIRAEAMKRLAEAADSAISFPDDAPGPRQLRQLHLQPGPVRRRARRRPGSLPQRCPHRRGRAGAAARRHRGLSRPLHPARGRHLGAADSRRRGTGARPGRVPGPPGDR